MYEISTASLEGLDNFQIKAFPWTSEKEAKHGKTIGYYRLDMFLFL